MARPTRNQYPDPVTQFIISFLMIGLFYAFVIFMIYAGVNRTNMFLEEAIESGVFTHEGTTYRVEEERR